MTTTSKVVFTTQIILSGLAIGVAAGLDKTVGIPLYVQYGANGLAAGLGISTFLHFLYILGSRN